MKVFTPARIETVMKLPTFSSCSAKSFQINSDILAHLGFPTAVDSQHNLVLPQPFSMSNSTNGTKTVSEKDSGNESEPDVSSLEFSKLKISPVPAALHPRPSHHQHRASASSCASRSNRRGKKSSAVSHTDSNPSPSSQISTKPAVATVTVAQLDRLFGAGAVTVSTSTTTTTTTSARGHVGVTGTIAATSPTSLEQNNNSLSSLRCPRPHPCCDNQKGSHKDKTKARVKSATSCAGYRGPVSSPLDDVYPREDFDDTDDEISQITSSVSSQGCASRSSSQLSCIKRKRTNTLSADLEVESLLESGTESVSSLDARSLSDFSDADHPVISELPRKRHCSGAVDESRPFLDLEKMQDQIQVKSSHRRPTALRITATCFGSGSRFSTAMRLSSPVQYQSREIVSSVTFCPLTPVEHPATCYS